MHGKTPEKFKTGDKIQNINKDCEHYKSTGTVKKVKNLPEIGSKDVKSKHNTPGQVVEYQVEQFETKEPVSVILSKNGWIKSIKGHQDNYDNIKYKEEFSFSNYN